MMKHLFFDDNIIEVTNLKRVWHKPAVFPEPVLKPVNEYEYDNGYCPVAAPFGDGVLYDESDGLFKLWYMAGWFGNTAYATSTDGINWTTHGLIRGIRNTSGYYYRDGCTVIRNPKTGHRFIMFIFYRQFDISIDAFELHHKKPVAYIGEIYGSDNGTDWEYMTDSGPGGDNSSFFFNNITDRWSFSIRTNNKNGERIRSYFDTPEFSSNPLWRDTDIEKWLEAEPEEEADSDLGYKPQLYKVDCAPYGDLLLGLFAIFYGPPNDECDKLKRPKIIDLKLGFSRNGSDWTISPEAFIKSSRTPGTWNHGYIHAAGGCFVGKDNMLRFYFGAFSGISPKLGGHMYSGGTTGLATIQKDRFVSLTPGMGTGRLFTKPLDLKGNSININANISGRLLVRIDGQETILEGDSDRHRVPVGRAGTHKAELVADRCDIYSIEFD